MGKQKPKFENSVVYKIYGLDSEITDIYVGVTTNLKSKDYHQVALSKVIQNVTDTFISS